MQDEGEGATVVYKGRTPLQFTHLLPKMISPQRGEGNLLGSP